MSDNWRIRIEPPEAEHGETLLERLGLDLGSDEAKRLAEELQGHRLAVSRDDDTIFVYTGPSPRPSRRARSSRPSSPRSGVEAEIDVERWLAEEERWSGEPRAGDLGAGGARPRPRAVGGAGGAPLARRGRQARRPARERGLRRRRRWRYLIVGAASEEDANALAKRVHGEAEPGGQVVWEATPQNPFAVFGGLGG